MKQVILVNCIRSSGQGVIPVHKIYTTMISCESVITDHQSTEGSLLNTLGAYLEEGCVACLTKLVSLECEKPDTSLGHTK